MRAASRASGSTIHAESLGRAQIRRALSPFDRKSDPWVVGKQQAQGSRPLDMVAKQHILRLVRVYQLFVKLKKLQTFP